MLYILWILLNVETSTSAEKKGAYVYDIENIWPENLFKTYFNTLGVFQVHYLPFS